MVHYRRAIQLNPGFAMAHFNYATTLWLSGRLDEAGAEFQEAIKIRPDYYTAHASYCDLLFKRGNLDAAEVEIRQLLRIEPDNPVSLYHYGDWLALSGKFEEADKTTGEGHPGRSGLFAAPPGMGTPFPGSGPAERGRSRIPIRPATVSCFRARSHWPGGILLPAWPARRGRAHLP